VADTGFNPWVLAKTPYLDTHGRLNYRTPTMFLTECPTHRAGNMPDQSYPYGGDGLAPIMGTKF